jgi:hypothetical protein
MAMFVVLNIDINAAQDIVEVQGIDDLDTLLKLDTECIDMHPMPGGMVQGQNGDNDEEPATDPAIGWQSFDEEMIYRAPILVNGSYICY